MGVIASSACARGASPRSPRSGVARSRPLWQRRDQRSGRPDGMELTELIREARSGSKPAADRLFTLVYDDLHRLAARQLQPFGGMATTSPAGAISSSWATT